MLCRVLNSFLIEWSGCTVSWFTKTDIFNWGNSLYAPPAKKSEKKGFLNSCGGLKIPITVKLLFDIFTSFFLRMAAQNLPNIKPYAVCHTLESYDKEFLHNNCIMKFCWRQLEQSECLECSECLESCGQSGQTTKCWILLQHGYFLKHDYNVHSLAFLKIFFPSIFCISNPMVRLDQFSTQSD